MEDGTWKEWEPECNNSNEQWMLNKERTMNYPCSFKVYSSSLCASPYRPFRGRVFPASLSMLTQAPCHLSFVVAYSLSFNSLSFLSFFLFFFFRFLLSLTCFLAL